MVSLSFLRPFLYLAVASAAPLLLTQCKTTAKSYKDVSYDAAKLKTPPGHGLDRKDYPFDESGVYRKDWVKSNTGGRDKSAGAVAEAPPVVASKKSGKPAAGSSRKPAAGSTSYPTYAEASAARSSDNFVGPASDAVGNVSASDDGADLSIGSSSVELASAGVSSADSTPVKAAPAAPRYHKVVSGDTLFRLASKYKSSVSELKRVNGLKSDSIRVGQSLRLP